MFFRLSTLRPASSLDRRPLGQQHPRLLDLHRWLFVSGWFLALRGGVGWWIGYKKTKTHFQHHSRHKDTPTSHRGPEGVNVLLKQIRRMRTRLMFNIASYSFLLCLILTTVELQERLLLLVQTTVEALWLLFFVNSLFRVCFNLNDNYLLLSLSLSLRSLRRQNMPRCFVVIQLKNRPTKEKFRKP